MGNLIEGRRFDRESMADKFRRAQLEAFLRDKKVYKSPDVPVLEDVTLFPNSAREVDILLKPGDLPIAKPKDLPSPNSIPVEALDYLKKSVKSRAAQGGLNVGGNSGTSRHLFAAGSKFAYSRMLEGYIAKVLVSNHTLRYVSLKEGSGLYRYYYLDETTKLRGDSLTQAVDAGLVEIDGTSWGYTGVPDPNGDIVPEGLYVDLDPSTYRAVNGFDLNPLVIDPKAPNFGRDAIDRHLRRPLKLPGVRQLLIGETPHMRLAPDVNIELKAMTTKMDPGIGYPVFGRQINSCLLDGGITNHKVRVEIEDWEEKKSKDLSFKPYRVYMEVFQNPSPDP